MYYCDFETEPIGKPNPYSRCKCCKVSVPQINGTLEGHLPSCEYRKKKEYEKRTEGINQMRTQTSETDTDNLFDLLDDVVNSLAILRSFHRKDKDHTGVCLTTDLIERVKVVLAQVSKEDK